MHIVNWLVNCETCCPPEDVVVVASIEEKT